MTKPLSTWDPENKEFWDTTGRKIAQRNLWISVPALLLAFALWQVWSVAVVKLPSIGFDFSTNQLFWLAAVPALSGATLRIFYSFMPAIFGGRRWTAFSTATLLLPAFGLGWAVQDPNTSYMTIFILACFSGFGGANFSSSMANISYFFPKASKGNALGINAGLGNLGVSVVQFVVPLIITVGLFGALGGSPQTLVGSEDKIWLQNAGFIWVPFIIVSTILAWFGMNDITSMKSSFKEQSVIFKRKHNWLMCWLYVGTFGSFIGFSAGFPLLIKHEFPHVDPMQYAFLGPLVSALSRVAGGWLSDRVSAARITQVSFIGMILAVIGVVNCLPSAGDAGWFAGFFTCFIILFCLTGVGNASTFTQTPIIFSRLAEMRNKTAASPLSASDLEREASKESAAIVGFMGGIAAYGGFLIPKGFGTSIAMTGEPVAALYGFLIFYISCALINYWYYDRKNAPVKC